MKYTWRILLTSVVLIVNTISLSKLESISFLPMSVFTVNILFIWLLGFQIDRYLFSKKQLHSTKTILTDYSRALDSAIDAIGITNAEGKYEFVNESLAYMYGYTKEEFLNMNLEKHFSNDSLVFLNGTVLPELSKHGYSIGEAVSVKRDGMTFPCEVSLSSIKETHKTIIVIRDLTKQKQQDAFMKNKAEHNELTNLPNRRRLLSDLDKAKLDSMETSVLFIDLDRFKIANDTLGHEVGDKLLIEVADRLNIFRNSFISTYHLGGDEFIVMIKNSDTEYIQSIAMDILEYIKKPFYIKGNEIFITASIGISSYPQHTENIYNLIKKADTAMYHAKLDGKNTFKFFNYELKLQLERKALIEIELRKAIKNEELYVHYQPKFDLLSSELAGVEALIRWKNPSLGNVSPMEFIPIAEDTGLITEIGNWVINEVLYQMRKWQEKGYPLVKVSVNVSQRQFRDNTLIPFIDSSLYSSNIEARFLELEVTESVLENFELVIPKITALKELGVGLSIDDFGTGYSSLNLLKNLPFDTLKIDQSFVRDLIGNSKDIDLIKTIITIGKTFNLNVVAEGIETAEHLDLLKQLECPMGQGYYFSKPISALELEEKYISKNKTIVTEEKFSR